jgi:Cu/Ag efflux protein CusF
MKRTILKFGLVGLLAVAVAGLPVCAGAANTNAPAAAKTKRAGAVPFHGKVKSVDKTAKTITLGEKTERTIQITSETKILKAEKPATLDEVTVGEQVSGAYKKDAEGKLNAVSLHIGKKEGAEKSEAK